MFFDGEAGRGGWKRMGEGIGRGERKRREEEKIGRERRKLNLEMGVFWSREWRERGGAVGRGGNMVSWIFKIKYEI